jgi:hypothetical protein
MLPAGRDFAWNFRVQTRNCSTVALAMFRCHKQLFSYSASIRSIVTSCVVGFMEKGERSWASFAPYSSRIASMASQWILYWLAHRVCFAASSAGCAPPTRTSTFRRVWRVARSSDFNARNGTSARNPLKKTPDKSSHNLNRFHNCSVYVPLPPERPRR